MEHRIGDGQQVGVECAETQGLERERDVCARWGLWDVGDETNGIQRPEIIVAGCIPETSRCNCLTIVHVSFRGVVAENPVYNNLDFAIGKPTLWSIPSFRLDGGGRHHEK